MKRSLLFLATALFVLSSCSSKKNKKQEPVNATTTNVEIVKKDPPTVPKRERVKNTIETKEQPVAEKKKEIVVDLPVLPREFRAAWVASVANINWPSKNNLSTAEQQQEAIGILDFLKNNNFNAVIFQVRPSADAFYKSDLEPWSFFLTGTEGQAPSPYYDPLDFWVEQAHKRGIELHVWLNPYRAHHTAGGAVTSASMARKMPESVVKLKQGYYWFDPSKKSTQDHASRVVMDIVKRYDIDGVHFDDYFYPYAEYNGGQDFPDSDSYNEYKRNGGDLSRGDFRRNSVNTFIERIYKDIKKEKNFVKFGISPFGIWKPGYPSGIQGSSQYDMLYADAKLWLNKGWIDYFAPQLYWPIQPAKQSYTALLKWWESENTLGRHLWPGINTVGRRGPEYVQEIVNQVEAARTLLPDNREGVIHWSLAGLTKNPAMTQALVNGPYQVKALVPTSPWLNANPLLKPTLLLTPQGGNIFAKWQHQQIDQVSKWVLYLNYGGVWQYEILDPGVTSKDIPTTLNNKKLQYVAVKAVDRLSNEGPYAAEKIK